jgi:hypothetical protein
MLFAFIIKKNAWSNITYITHPTWSQHLVHFWTDSPLRVLTAKPCCQHPRGRVAPYESESAWRVAGSNPSLLPKPNGNVVSSANWKVPKSQNDILCYWPMVPFENSWIQGKHIARGTPYATLSNPSQTFFMIWPLGRLRERWRTRRAARECWTRALPASSRTRRSAHSTWDT